MDSDIKRYSSIVWQLLKTDFIIFKQTLLEEVVNLITWLSSFILVFAYAYPTLGMTKAFGVFIALSFIVGEAYWRIWDNSFNLINDLEGDRRIDYYCILPLPTWLILLKEIIAFAYKGFVFAFISCPLSIVLLWSRIKWEHVSFVRFFFIFFVISWFMGSFFIFLTSLIKNSKSTRKIGIRILFPLWMFGATEFPWYNIYNKLSPSIAYLFFANPILYAMEGMHSAVLDSSGYLPFWVCVGVLVLMTAIFGFLGISRFMRRLDLI